MMDANLRRNFFISVIIPARNEENMVGKVVSTVLAQQTKYTQLEVIVVNDNSTDRTAQVAKTAGATVLHLDADADSGNPAAARNRGAHASHGDWIIFLDCDCIPAAGWLESLIESHNKGYKVVGGSLDLPPGLSFSARCDYYCGWYHAHSARRSGVVSQHPPCNLSVQRNAFMRTQGYCEKPPIAYSHEELAWQAEYAKSGGRIFFSPQARVYHYNRPGFANLLRRNYRWGYGAIEAKAGLDITRFAFLYHSPGFLIAASVPLGLLSALYILICWLSARQWQVILMSPMIVLARIAYAVGMMKGGIRWLRHRDNPSVSYRPRWE